MKKIVFIVDSFKNTISSTTLCELADKTINEFYPEIPFNTLITADGGEGTVDAAIKYLNLQKQEVVIKNAFLQPINAYYGSNGTVAVIDAATAVGFDVNKNNQLNPGVTSTYGIGEMVRDAADKGCKKIYIGLGGTITNDGGCGMLSAMGARFYENGREFTPIGNTLNQITSCDFDLLHNYQNVELIGLCDVTNPLHGTNGAAYVFAHQKGATEEQIAMLDKGLENLARVVGLNPDFPGSGAAGGLGYAVLCLHGKLQSGAEMILKWSNFAELIDSNTVVITGEGKLDEQSVSGKLISKVTEIALQRKAKIILLVGCTTLRNSLFGIEKIFAINKIERPFEQVKANACQDFIKTLKEVVNYIINE